MLSLLWKETQFFQLITILIQDSRNNYTTRLEASGMPLHSNVSFGEGFSILQKFSFSKILVNIMRRFGIRKMEGQCGKWHSEKGFM